jgi:Cu(I)/Ag(I) efflux system membrane protein CusA/SilA
MGHDLSVAGGVGFIALAGVAAEFGVMMVMYLKQALGQRVASGMTITPAVVDDAIREGAVMRVRPKAITVFTLLAGLAPVVFGTGTGSELMSRIAAPMLGGMVTAPLLSLFIVPAVYALLRRPTNGAGRAGETARPPAAAGSVREESGDPTTGAVS